MGIAGDAGVERCSPPLVVSGMYRVVHIRGNIGRLRRGCAMLDPRTWVSGRVSRAKARCMDEVMGVFHCVLMLRNRRHFHGSYLKGPSQPCRECKQLVAMPTAVSSCLVIRDTRRRRPSALNPNPHRILESFQNMTALGRVAGSSRNPGFDTIFPLFPGAHPVNPLH